MSPDHLETLYTRLAEALGRVGDDKANLLLATLSLELVARHADPAVVEAAIERAERLART